MGIIQSFALGSYAHTTRMSLNVENQPIQKIMDDVFAGSDITYKVEDSQIALNNSDAIFNFNQVNQQQRAVSGKVTDAYGQPLPGVTVVVKGTTQGTVTNADGEYSLSNIPENATLVFSFVGMRTQEVVVGSQTTIDITMEEESIGLEEVVAVGYGTMQRNKISTAITSIDPESISKQVTNSIDRALEGRVAGLSIKQNTGAPGGGAVMRLRGSASLQGNNVPLVVIDGVPIQGGYDKERSPLALVDQQDIESIEVLKDVSATAIYGSRGSNGVILITTKSGKVGRTNLNVNISSGVSSMIASEKLPLMNAEEFARWRKENAFESAAFYGREITLEDIPEAYRNPEYWRDKGTDWQDEMVRIAPRMRFNMNISHGTEKFTGYFSMGYTQEEGIVKETGFKSLNMRANMDYTPNKYLKIGLNISPTMRWWGNKSTHNNPFSSRGTGVGLFMMVPPTDGPYIDDYPNEQPGYSDGKWDTNIYSPGTFNFDNPLYKLKKQVDNTQYFDIFMSPYIQISPLAGLDFKSQFNLQIGQSNNEYFKPSTIKNQVGGWGGVPPRPISGYYNTGKNMNWQFENTLNYQKNFGDHHLNALVGYTMEHYNYYGSSLNGMDYPSDDVKTLNAATNYSGSSNESNWSLISGIMRVNYDFETKYLLTASIRRDGSSRFGRENRWGYFPSVALGWNLSKESFFPDADWVTNIKLRTSYGTSGNNNIGNYTWIPNLSISNYNFGGSLANGKYVSTLENPFLGWEQTQELNIGVDATLYNGRLNFIIDFYNKITSDMLWDVSIPISSGYASSVDNVGEILNRGLEFTISSTNIQKNDLEWQTDFNISFNHNEVLDLGRVNEMTMQASHSGDALLIRVGEPLGMFYGWITEGVFMNEAETKQYATIPGGQLPGTTRWRDQNGDGIIDVNDKVIMGNPHPAFRGGMYNKINYKNWDFDFTLSYAHDFDVYASLESTSLNLDGVFNVLKDVENRWRSPEEPGDGKMPTTIHQTYLDRDLPQSKFVYNVSFLKVQNLSLGYTFNTHSSRQMRLSFTVQNPFLLTNYKYGNPDVDTTGLSSQPNYDEYDYPLARTFELGLNLTF
jgi:TonB-linked SusC/RagA family outer membrane protein